MSKSFNFIHSCAILLNMYTFRKSRVKNKTKTNIQLHISIITRCIFEVMCWFCVAQKAQITSEWRRRKIKRYYHFESVAETGQKEFCSFQFKTSSSKLPVLFAAIRQLSRISFIKSPPKAMKEFQLDDPTATLSQQLTHSLKSAQLVFPFEKCIFDIRETQFQYYIFFSFFNLIDIQYQNIYQK